MIYRITNRSKTSFHCQNKTKIADCILIDREAIDLVLKPNVRFREVQKSSKSDRFLIDVLDGYSSSSSRNCLDDFVFLKELSV